jgi:predicted dehydrogenase
VTTLSRLTRRAALKRAAAATLVAPFTFRAFGAAPGETLLHASIGASGQAGADVRALTASSHLKLVAVADVDLAHTAAVRKRFPDVRVYQDWRELLDKEKDLDSVNVSTPDHVHAAATLRAMQLGKHVYTQKPLTHTLHEARRLAVTARDKGVVTQMGIQIHGHPTHRAVVQLVRGGAVGKVQEVHSWSNKRWGDRAPRPDRSDPVPPDFNWDLWLAGAAPRPFLGGGYYHPSNWRKRLDFGTGTFGDMGCHILDPVFGSLALTAPTSVHSEGGGPNEFNWGLDAQVRYAFPGTKYTAETLTLTWYDGERRLPPPVRALLGELSPSDQGSVYLGTEGVLYSPYFASPVLLPHEKFQGFKVPAPRAVDHYLEFVEACRGHGKTSTPFDYSGPLTEVVLLGCLATRFPKTTLEWDAGVLKVTNVAEANRFVRQEPRKGWEVEGL